MLCGEWRVHSKDPVSHSFDLMIHSVRETEHDDPHIRAWTFEGGAEGLYVTCEARALLDTRVNHLKLCYTEVWTPGLQFGRELNQLSSHLTRLEHQVMPQFGSRVRANLEAS